MDFLSLSRWISFLCMIHQVASYYIDMCVTLMVVAMPTFRINRKVINLQNLYFIKVNCGFCNL